MNPFKRKSAAAVEAPLRPDKVVALIKTGMDRSEALDRDMDQTDPAGWERLVAADEAAWQDATPVERRAAADALQLHHYH
ncbi:hypothetical protein AB0J14_05040 [Micromonospora arborensis]|uniref:hypothetical protein n=1 Tax=Micromonospora arborensis TaxID=2116518 RepID=UPI0033E6F6DC